MAVIKTKSFITGNINKDINKVAVNSLIMIMFIYSAIKISAKAPPLYSVLNPDTSSDSPSAKSKGVRLVSASMVVNQITISRGSKIITGVICIENISNRFKDWNMIRGAIRISAILTSYEMVCAALRKAPRSAYLELDAHPAIRVVYTLNLEIHRNKRIP